MVRVVGGEDLLAKKKQMAAEAVIDSTLREDRTEMTEMTAVDRAAIARAIVHPATAHQVEMDRQEAMDRLEAMDHQVAGRQDRMIRRWSA